MSEDTSVKHDEAALNWSLGSVTMNVALILQNIQLQVSNLELVTYAMSQDYEGKYKEKLSNSFKKIDELRTDNEKHVKELTEIARLFQGRKS